MNYFKIYLTPQGIQIQDQEGNVAKRKKLIGIYSLIKRIF